MMGEAEPQMNLSAPQEADVGEEAPRRTRTCVGCGERVDALGPDGRDLIRLILGPDGEIAVDPKGGGFGRGAHVHARRTCLERAARAGLLRATKGQGHLLEDGVDTTQTAARVALSAGSLARAIQRSMDRRIEGLLVAAVRSRQLARGSDAVTGACRRGDGKLVVVACDAAAAAELTEVRRAVAEGRAVAWGTKARLGAIVAPAAVRGRLAPPQDSTLGALPPDPRAPVPEGIGVVAIASRQIGEALRHAAHAVDAVASLDGAPAPPDGSGSGGGSPRAARRARSRSDV
jgi:predicted RNA-binding protein YlxR (DUF448 family)/ribosomal protein L7Ae-like RNA K-turn-binding protein